MADPLPGIELGAAWRRGRRRVQLPPLGLPAPRAGAGPWLGLLAMGVGVAVWYVFFVVSPTHPGEPFPGARRWGATAFAAVFFLFGLRFALEGLRAPDRWRQRRFRGGGEPWGEGYRWRREMAALPRAEGGGWAKGGVGLLALAAFGAVINLVWFDLDALTGAVWLAYLLVPLFTLVILFLLGAAAWEAGRQLLYRTPRLRFETYPAVPGDELRAVVDHRGRFRRAKSVRLALACFEQGPPRRETGFAQVEWLLGAERTVAAADLAARPRQLEVRFHLPPDAPPTQLDRPDGSRRYWLLEVAGARRKTGARESFAFLVPVYTAAPAP